MIHAMIDLETLSTKPNATILTIGGVKVRRLHKSGTLARLVPQD